jgi:carbon monoxide dehydrogenase subunit G
MEMKGERLLPGDRATAWRLLNDGETLKRCLPGCESLTATGPDTYDVVMNAAVGPVKARFKGKMSLTDIEPPVRYRLKFEGQSAQAGFARGEARVELEEVSVSETRLRYTASAQIGGKLAQIGSRLIDAAAGATAEKFFEAFARQLAATAGAPKAGIAAGPAPSASAEFGFWRWLVTFLRLLLRRSGGG